MLSCIAVGLGGFVGAVARYLLGLIPLGHSSAFPFVTLLINLIGSFAIGVISQLAFERGSGNTFLVLFLKVGVCGGFTTFSTFALESGNLIENGRGALAAVYIFLSVALCIAGVLLGKMVAKRLAV
ncbi:MULTISPECIES: fluoride efflux transporter CrcB [unclassified Ruminococcus]|uniref:fluoride efflux transporter CrcB n=1 Tax=unclassified Ruminococcus TaxID=2608920 RepID=UPI00210D9828|nr:MULTISPECIES: fluoride efflux transporter CrcB [unclassified Ruminococcus]MCQ4021905.1 fluoride efflux transporter CrcB [Ruminococcus sp. zg-924]MCQ4114350.1 fluoride efflux transporter CrcB [Ruminococcus sp. zg-921]